MRLRTSLIALSLSGVTVGCAENSAPTAPVGAADAPAFSLSPGTATAGTIVSKAGSNLCMDVKGISTSPGTPLQVYTCKTGQKNQQFLWKSDSTIQAYSGGTLCVADAGGLGQDGDRIVVVSCNGAPAQKWGVTAAGQIQGTSAKCIAVPTAATGTVLALATCATGTSQQWDVNISAAPAPAPSPNPAAGGGTVDFHAIAGGIRPRGFGQGTYTLAVPTASGRSLYVATTGSDANSGAAGAPFRTIVKAAQVARAGDVVTIASGTYGGSVVVANSGTSSAPIVFQAAARGGVVLSDGHASFRPSEWSGGVQETGQLYVTVRGLTFRGYAANTVGSPGPSFPAALKAARGWRVEDCLFDNAGNTAVEIEGSYVTVVKSTLQYTYYEALAAWAHSSATRVTDANYTPLDGIQVVDVVLRGNFTLNQKPVSGGVADYSSKFLATRGTVLDNVEAYENNGPGFWFDTQNSDLTVRNGYFHDNRNIAGTTSTGRGLNFEANWGPALVENNVFANNASVGLEVTSTQGVTIRHNLFVGNPRCIELTNDLSRAATFPLKNIGVYANQCGGFTNFSGIQTVGGSAAFTTPAAMSIKADSNVYQPGGTNLYLGWWENKSIGGAATVADFRTKWGWEANGRTGTVAW